MKPALEVDARSPVLLRGAGVGLAGVRETEEVDL